MSECFAYDLAEGRHKGNQEDLSAGGCGPAQPQLEEAGWREAAQDRPFHGRRGHRSLLHPGGRKGKAKRAGNLGWAEGFCSQTNMISMSVLTSHRTTGTPTFLA